MNYIHVFSIIMVVFLFQNCSSTHKSIKAQSVSFEIYFGRTGGFTNLNPTYGIKSNGEISKRDNVNAQFYTLKKIEKSRIDSIYTMITQSNFNNLSINEVSNITHYIEFKSEKINNKITWYDDSQIPEEVKKLHQFLLKAIN